MRLHFSPNAVLNALSSFLVAYALIAFGCLWYLQDLWIKAAPHTADFKSGLIFPHNEHGSITYFSAFQRTSCSLLSWPSIVAFFIAILIVPKKDLVITNYWIAFRADWNRYDPKNVAALGGICGCIGAPIIIFGLGPFVVNFLNGAGG